MEWGLEPHDESKSTDFWLPFSAGGVYDLAAYPVSASDTKTTQEVFYINDGHQK